LSRVGTCVIGTEVEAVGHSEARTVWFNGKRSPAAQIGKKANTAINRALRGIIKNTITGLREAVAGGGGFMPGTKLS
jgi:hypothetical protein